MKVGEFRGPAELLGDFARVTVHGGCVTLTFLVVDDLVNAYSTVSERVSE